MITSLKHLSAERRQQIRGIIKIITSSIHPEKIILHGIFASPSPGSDLHLYDQIPAYLYSYDILVVTRRNDFRCDHSLQDIVENRCRFATPVTVLVHDIDHVNKQLSQGQFFFFRLIREGILLYDAGNTQLVEGVHPDLIRVRDIARADYEKWWSRASAFFKTALFNRQQKEWGLTVFNLHQTAEQTYQAILLVFTGYKPCTHNLDKLRRYTNRLSLELALLFPRNTKEEDRLFKLLLQGYVDGRYKGDYSVTEEEVGLLAERVGKLHSIAANLCRNQFTILAKMSEAA